MQLDSLDRKILGLLTQEPRAGVREYARRLHVARATVQSRLDKLVDAGVIESYVPQLNVERLGFPLSAYLHLRLQQHDFDATVRQLARIPFITQADSVAGSDDVTCGVVARDHAHLEDISLAVMQIDGVERIRTEIVMRHRIPPRVEQLIDHLESEG